MYAFSAKINVCTYSKVSEATGCQNATWSQFSVTSVSYFSMPLNIRVKRATFLHHISEVPGSNIHKESAYSDSTFSIVSSETQIILQLLPSTSFPIHYAIILCYRVRDTCSIVKQTFNAHFIHTNLYCNLLLQIL
jgi:ribulose-5-phosphate 4-epimerase/fuculose-1-phosphate aldolase